MYDFITLDVYPKANGITITNVSNKKLNLTVDDTFQLEYSITPGTVLDKTVTWESENPEIANVDKNGKITAYTSGNATIIGTSNDNKNKIDSITVEVSRHNDPFHHTNIEYVRYTKIPDSDGDFLLCVMKSVLNSEAYFSAVDINGNHEKYFFISSELKATLISMNDKYLENNLVATDSEKLVNLSKKYTDDLVLKDFITNNSDEYYGVWAYNYEAFCKKGNIYSKILDRALKAYNIYLTLSGYYHSTLAPASSQTLTTMQYKSLYNQIDDLAIFMTKNPNSNKVMLGTTTDDIAWHEVGEIEKMTYFYSSNWDSLVSYYTDDIMIAANKQFLFTQKAAGKQFWFSHNPMATLQNYPNSSFAMELNWLKDSYGLKQLTSANFVKSGAYWYFVP